MNFLTIIPATEAKREYSIAINLDNVTSYSINYEASCDCFWLRFRLLNIETPTKSLLLQNKVRLLNHLDTSKTPLNDPRVLEMIKMTMLLLARKIYIATTEDVEGKLDLNEISSFMLEFLNKKSCDDDDGLAEIYEFYAKAFKEEVENDSNRKAKK